MITLINTAYFITHFFDTNMFYVIDCGLNCYNIPIAELPFINATLGGEDLFRQQSNLRFLLLVFQLQWHITMDIAMKEFQTIWSKLRETILVLILISFWLIQENLSILTGLEPETMSRRHRIIFEIKYQMRFLLNKFRLLQVHLHIENI